MRRRPPIAFLPGASGAGEFWRPVAERLADTWPTTLLNWPGAGAQPHDPGVQSYEDLIALTAAALDDNSDIVAQSMGGVVAIGLALAHAAKVRRLVLVATSGGLNIDSHGAEDWRAEYEAEFPAAAPWITAQRLDYGDALATIPAPTCLIWGDADPISPVSAGQRLHDVLPASTLHILPGATHSLGRERPDAVAALITAHLR
jgi:pimeloyl-ACP methyl ester carboxylesterase